MAYGESNGHVKVKTRDPNMLRAQYLENGRRQRLRSAGPPIGLIEQGLTSPPTQYRLGYLGDRPPIGNGTWGIKWSHD